jgi:hypothetical protein
MVSPTLWHFYKCHKSDTPPIRLVLQLRSLRVTESHYEDFGIRRNGGGL